MRIVSNIKILLECSSFVLSSNVPVVRGIKKAKVLEEALRKGREKIFQFWHPIKYRMY